MIKFNYWRYLQYIQAECQHHICFLPGLGCLCHFNFFYGRSNAAGIETRSLLILSLFGMELKLVYKLLH